MNNQLTGIIDRLREKIHPIVKDVGEYVMATGDDFETCRGDYSLAMETLTAGDEFPSEICDGDVYVYGDYEYRYNYGFEGEWFTCNCDGWGATVVDSKKLIQ